ncbi:nuclease [Tulasnella sp. 425]|nr:nuclease [Tulasnella sp. 425]
MPGASALHFAAFGLGAVLGAGATAIITKRKDALPVAPPAHHPVQVPSPQQPRPVIQIDERNRPQISNSSDIAMLGGNVPGVLKYGHPGPTPDFLVRKAYVASYDRRLRHPAWTAEHLTLSSLGKSRVDGSNPDAPKGDRGKSEFLEDPAIPTPFRARMQDYFRSGYDRGHMVPAADAKSSQEAMNETFFLTNIAPQVGDDWVYLEDWCRRQTSVFSDVYVFTVPLYLPKQEADGKWRTTYEVIGSPPNVAVPTHFAKVVLGTKPSSPSTPSIQELSLGAFVLPNAPIPDDTPLTNFAVPVDSVERAAGLTLFSDAIKQGSKNICQTSKCEVIVRRFDDANRQSQKRISAPSGRV